MRHRADACFFFFSSRRRHTRLQGDWSSDVCSSDLVVKLPGQPNDLSLVFFGLYCLLIGYLIFRSTFLPRVVGGLMVFAGLGWLTFLSPSLARDLFPYVLAPGIIGEGSLTLWLLLFGVDAQQWTELANAR